MRRPAVRALAVAAMLVLAGATAACGDDDGDIADGETAQVKVGAIPIVDVAPLHLGVAKGFFKEQGLDVQVINTTGGAAAVPGVVSGQFDFAFGNVVSLIVAKSQGLELKAVAAGNSSTGIAGQGLQRRRRPAGQLDHRRRRPGRQDRGRQQPQERRRHDGPRLHPQGRRRPDEGEVRRAAVPGDAGRGREQARGRRLDRRAVLHRRAGPGREGRRLQLRGRRPEHDGVHVLHLAADDPREAAASPSGSPPPSRSPCSTRRTTRTRPARCC